jgi:hypothetical protein
LLKVDNYIPIELAAKCVSTLHKKGQLLENTDQDLLHAIWAEFFKEAEIPQDRADTYTKSFIKQCFRFKFLGSISMDFLKLMEIDDYLGDCQGIIVTAKTV